MASLPALGAPWWEDNMPATPSEADPFSAGSNEIYDDFPHEYSYQDDRHLVQSDSGDDMQGMEYLQMDMFSSCGTPTPFVMSPASATTPRGASSSEYEWPLAEHETPTNHQQIQSDPQVTEALQSTLPEPQQNEPPRKVKPKRKRRRDAEALARCREHSARARLRRKRERKALEQRAAMKTMEALQAKENVEKLERVAWELKSAMFESAISLQYYAMVAPRMVQPAQAMLAMVQVHAIANYTCPYGPPKEPSPKPPSWRPPLCPKPNINLGTGEFQHGGQSASDDHSDADQPIASTIACAQQSGMPGDVVVID
eukprot:comp16740_c0_seq1/m.15050 comp16740_c0_seq1/g.15050  ORF comp16740_c0_seq1/g.15050 comp16740_c0_seq1/m.15050 type:complete len:313 (-) comp16740_c0_seq1:565-1503(-)